MIQASTLTDNNNAELALDGYMSDLSNDEDGHPKVFAKLGSSET